MNTPEIFALGTNLLIMAISLWLGLYIVTRNSKSLTSWLVSLTIWAMFSYHLYNAMEIRPPGTDKWIWLRPISYFGLPIWVHTSFLFRREIHEVKQMPKIQEYAIVIFVYFITLAILLLGGFSTDVNSEAGPFYLGIIIFLIGAAYLFGFNLLKCSLNTTDPVLQAVFMLLLIFTIVIALGGLLRGIIILFSLQFSTVWSDLVMGIGIMGYGYTVAKHDAFMHGKRIEQDFMYSFVGVSLATIFFISIMIPFISEGSSVIIPLSTVIVGAIISHTLFDGGRTILDRFFYQDQFSELRSNLRKLASEVGTSQSLSDQLQSITYVLCNTFRVKQCFIALLVEDNTHIIKASQGKYIPGQIISLSNLWTDEIRELPCEGQSDFLDMALFVPLRSAGTRIGVLVLGPKESGRDFNDTDIERLDDIAHQVAAVINGVNTQERTVESINMQIAKFREESRHLHIQSQKILNVNKAATNDGNNTEFRSLVEDCLRNLYDYSYLGNSQLAYLKTVDTYLKDANPISPTHTDRGKALHQLLNDAITKLQPNEQEPNPKDVPSRKWQPYLVLHEPYVQQKPTRDVWIQLDVSERTFHRIRKRAIDSIASILQEMENNSS